MYFDRRFDSWKEKGTWSVQERIEASKIAYHFFYCTACIIEGYSQYTIIALTRSCAALVNHKLSLAFMVKKKKLDQMPTSASKKQWEYSRTKILDDPKSNWSCYKGTSFGRSGWKVTSSRWGVYLEKPPANKSKHKKFKQGWAQMITRYAKEAKIQADIAAESVWLTSVPE